jgi:hypothetical protein
MAGFLPSEGEIFIAGYDTQSLFQKLLNDVAKLMPAACGRAVDHPCEEKPEGR